MARAHTCTPPLHTTVPALPAYLRCLPPPPLSSVRCLLFLLFSRLLSSLESFHPPEIDEKSRRGRDRVRVYSADIFGDWNSTGIRLRRRRCGVRRECVEFAEYQLFRWGRLEMPQPLMRPAQTRPAPPEPASSIGAHRCWLGTTPPKGRAERYTTAPRSVQRLPGLAQNGYQDPAYLAVGPRTAPAPRGGNPA
jgi:hypothetical protein